MSPWVAVSCVGSILALIALGLGAMVRSRTLYLPANADTSQPVNQEAERKRTEKIRAQSQLKVWGYCALVFVMIACGILVMPSVKKVSAALGATSTPTPTNTATITPTPTITNTPTITPTRLTSTPGTFSATAIHGSPTVTLQPGIQTVVVHVNQTVIVKQTQIVKVPVTVIVVVTATFTHTPTPTGTMSPTETPSPTLTPTETPTPTGLSYP